MFRRARPETIAIFRLADRARLPHRRLPLLGIALLAALGGGCAAQNPRMPVIGPSAAVAPPSNPAMVTHTVSPKETLWSIARRYGVAYQELMRVNGLKNPTQLSVGATLLIPEPLAPSREQAPPLPPIPLYPNPRWQYIVIHHSATATGSAKMLDRVHRNRGFSNGLGYHFVVDNGTLSKRDGQIEIGPRWTKQERGAHCNAGGMNVHGIGICLVGDFTHHPISQAQMGALVQLVRQLQRYYGIPVSRVIRHKDVPGKRTACPGNQFPWTEFRRRLYKSRAGA